MISPSMAVTSLSDGLQIMGLTTLKFALVCNINEVKIKRAIEQLGDGSLDGLDDNGFDDNDLGDNGLDDDEIFDDVVFDGFMIDLGGSSSWIGFETDFIFLIGCSEGIVSISQSLLIRSTLDGEETSLNVDCS